MFNIEEFKSKGLALGGARPSQFFVDVSPPPILGFTQDVFRFVCTAASIPPEMMAPVEVAYFGRRVKYIGDREFPDWTVSVINDANFLVRRMLEAWSQAMNYHVSNVMDGSIWPVDYKQTAIVTQMRQDGETIASYEMVGLFPTQVDPIPLSWEDVNNIERFEVTFSYDYWVQRQGDNLAASSADGTSETVIPPVNNG